MIDFAAVLVLATLAVILVRRVRDLGFAGLRPPETWLASVGRVVLPDAPREPAEAGGSSYPTGGTITRDSGVQPPPAWWAPRSLATDHPQPEPEPATEP